MGGGSISGSATNPIVDDAADLLVGGQFVINVNDIGATVDRLRNFNTSDIRVGAGPATPGGTFGVGAMGWKCLLDDARRE
jgi:hypothetical protein